MATRDARVRLQATGASQFASAMRNAAGATNTFARRLETARVSTVNLNTGLRSARNGIRALVAALAVRQVARFAEEMITISSSLVETGTAIGTTSDELETFQRVLQGQGVTAQQAAEGLGQLNRRIGEARQGVGTARDIFNQLGVSLTDFQGNARGTLDVFRDLVRATEGFNAQERARILGLTVGEEAARRWAAAVADGADAFIAAENQQRRFGVATQEENESLKALGQTMLEVRNSLQTFGRVVLASLAPALQEMGTNIRDAVAVMIQMEQRSQTFSSIIEQIRVRLQRVVEALRILITGFGQLILSLGIGTRVAGLFTRGATRLFSAFRRITFSVAGSQVALARFGGRLRWLAPVFMLLSNLAQRLGPIISGAFGIFGAVYVFRGIGRLRDALRALFEEFVQVRREMSEFSAGMDGLNASVGSAVSQLNALRDAGQVTAAGFAGFNDRIVNIGQAMAIANRLFVTGRLTQEQYGTQVKLLREELRRVVGEMNALVSASEEVNAELSRFTRENLFVDLGRSLARNADVRNAFGFRDTFLFLERQGPRSVHAIRRAWEQLQDVQLRSLNLTRITLDVFGENVLEERTRRRVERFRAAFEPLRQAALAVQQAMASAGAAIADAFADAVLEARNLIDVIDALARTIARTFIQATIGQRLSSFLGGLVSIPGTAEGGVSPAGTVVNNYITGFSPEQYSAIARTVSDGRAQELAGGTSVPSAFTRVEVSG